MKASGPPRRIPAVYVIVLGIDPGVANTGYGVVAQQRGRMVALDGGVIETAAGRDAGARLAVIYDRVGALLDEYRPDAVALEDVYFGTNARSAFAVGQARGVVMLAAGQRAVPCASYTPQQVKGAVLRLRPRGQGPGAADGPDAARARRAAAARPRRRRARGRDLPHQRSAARGGAGRMIALLEGTVAVRRADHVVVSCGGVGYRLAVSAETLRHVPRVGAGRDGPHAPDRA